MRALGALSGKKVNPSSFGMQNFTVLEQQGDEELVFGLIGSSGSWTTGSTPSPPPPSSWRLTSPTSPN
jgi:hypothetical protein